MSEELVEQPLYYVLDNLCNVIHSTTPSHAQFRSALLHAGYKVSSTHCHEAGIKTNATADGKCNNWALFYLAIHLFHSHIFINREENGGYCYICIHWCHVLYNLLPGRSPETWDKKRLGFKAMERPFTIHFTTTRLLHLVKNM